MVTTGLTFLSICRAAWYPASDDPLFPFFKPHVPAELEAKSVPFCAFEKEISVLLRDEVIQHSNRKGVWSMESGLIG